MIGKWKLWECGICGKEYSTIEERMACEQKCKKDAEALHKQIEIEKLRVEIGKKKKEMDILREQYNNVNEKYNNVNIEYAMLEAQLYDLERGRLKTDVKGFVNGKELSDNEAYKVLSSNEAVKVLREILGI